MTRPHGDVRPVTINGPEVEFHDATTGALLFKGPGSSTTTLEYYCAHCDTWALGSHGILTLPLGSCPTCETPYRDTN